MVAFDTGSTLADRFRAHAGDEGTAMARSLYGYAMRGMAEDWEAGGIVRAICRGWEESPPGTTVQLRLLAGVFRIVLSGRAPALQPYYACLGGSAAPQTVWPVMRAVMAEHPQELAAGLRLAPQTNEVGRAGVLAVGLFEAVRSHGIRRIRLLEPGASGGLNLNVDRYRLVGEDWAWGPVDSALCLDTRSWGVRPEALEIVQRRGCDLAPVAAHTREGAAYLTSFVWPWQLERHERLHAALEVARRHPVTVDEAPAADWLRAQLRLGDPDVLTVVWQSITRQYWPREEVEAVESIVSQSASRIPLAYVTMEYPDDGAHAQLAVDGRVIGRVHHHGVPLWG